MGLDSGARDSESRFAAYVGAITSALGHADRATPFHAYCAGLLLPGDRKGVEPMAARVQPGRVQAAHQSMHHLVAKANWSDAAVLAAVASHVLPAIKQRGPIRALIVDDTGMPKKGRHSVGVARQCCGQLGKQDNCQVAVSLSLAHGHASLPLAYRLYLPQEWADDPARRAGAGVPDDVAFQTKPRIALDQLGAALAAGIDADFALADAGYGRDTEFRDGVTDLGLPYGPPSSARPACGRLAWRRRPGRGAGAGARRPQSGATPGASRFQPGNWRWTCRSRRGGASPGAKAATPSSPRASPPCACVPRIAIANAPRHVRRNGA